MAGIRCSDPIERLLECLDEEDMLTEGNLSLITINRNPIELLGAVSRLKKAKLLTQENFTLMTKSSDANALALILTALHGGDILSARNCQLSTLYPNLKLLSQTLFKLTNAKILTEENFKMVMAHTNLSDLKEGLDYIYEAELLTQDNFAALCEQKNLEELVFLLDYLNDATLLTQENFLSILLPAHQALLSHDCINLFWSRVPSDRFTQHHYQQLLIAARDEHPLEAILQIRDQILRPRAGAGAPTAVKLNDAQSTHTSSVHRSVSRSALTLWTNYQATFDLESKIKEIRDFVHGLNESPKHQAAKRCVEHLITHHDTFIDKSGISLRQLLALVYVAIHDEEKRRDSSSHPVSLAVAKGLLIDGLYEIQRGYNLNEQDGDDGQVDARICFAGIFNKLIEKLNGIHQDVEVYFITHAGAMNKFPKLVQQHVLQYLSRLASPSTIEGYEEVMLLIRAMETDGNLGAIWSEISAKVQEELWSEFSEAYENLPTDSRFTSLISYYHTVELPDLTLIKAQLFDSIGYRLHLERAAPSTVGMFSLNDKENTDPAHRKRPRT